MGTSPRTAAGRNERMVVKEYLRRVFRGTAEEFLQKAEKAMESGEKLFVVTANPEIVMHAQREKDIADMLLNEKTAIVPDGISVVKAMNMLGMNAKERIAGVDLAEALLKKAGEQGKSVFLLGAREEVISALKEKLTREYPQINLKVRNGYDGDKDEMFEKEIVPFAPDLVLVGLGVPAQEKLISRHIEKFQKGVFIGVGGSFDVLSGKKQRAPSFFVKTNTEWLYRIAREPSRLKRFYQNNVKFLGEVRREARKK